ncbi:MAG: oligosaccharide flippase family protein [Pseudomonadota bacterium]
MTGNDVNHPSPEEVGGLVKTSAKWVLIFLVIRQLSTIVATALLSRMVSPAETGLFSMAAIVASFVVLFDTGLVWATVQASSMSEKKISSLVAMNMVVGVGVYIICAASGPVIAGFFDEPKLIHVMLVLGLAPAFNSLATQFSALLKRQLRNKEVGSVEFSSIVISSVLAVLVAWLGGGVWALVSQLVFLNFFRCIFFYRKYEGRIHLSLNREGLSVFVQGGKLALSNYVCFFQLYMGQILVGKFFGAEVLGYYGKALALRALPLNYMAMIATDIVVASIAAMSVTGSERNAFYLKSVAMVGFFGCGLMGLLYPLAYEVVDILYGDQWTQVAKILQIMVFAGLIMPFVSAATWMFLGRGMAKGQLHINIVNTLISLVAYIFIWKISRDVFDFVLYESVLMAALAVTTMYWASRCCDFDFSGLIYVALVCIAAAITAALIVGWLPQSATVKADISLYHVLGVISVYGLIYSLVCVTLLRDLRDFIFERLKLK